MTALNLGKLDGGWIITDVASDLSKLAADPDQPLACEVARLGRKQLKKILALTEKKDWTEVESIHDMRVATRRIRELVKIQLQTEKSGAMKEIYRFARELGKRLGVVRGQDVLIKGLQRLGNGDPIRLMTLAISIGRRESVAKLKVLRQSDQFDDWAHHAKREFDRPNEDGPTVEEAAGDLIEKGKAKVQAHRHLDPQGDFSRLHTLRIDAKHLRYRVEFFAHVPGRQTEVALIDLTDLQDHLGDLHDDILLLEQIEDALSVVPDWSEEERAQLALFRSEVSERIAEERAKSPEKWAFVFKEDFLFLQK